MKRALFLGHSHLGAIVQAYREYPEAAAGISIEFASLADDYYLPNVVDGRISPAISDVLKAPRFDAILSVIGGNEHCSLGTTNHPQPYDIIVPSHPHLAVQTGSRILPCGIVKQRLRAMAHEILPVLPALRAATDKTIIHFESPPPVPSDDHIKTHAKHFGDLIHRYGLSSATRRYKFWLLQSEMMSGVCLENDISYVQAPPDMTDASGFLKEPAWIDDPTHAGVAYGRAVLLQVAVLLGHSG